MGRAHNGWEGMATGNQVRKLRNDIFKHKHEARANWEWYEDINISIIDSSVGLRLSSVVSFHSP